MFSDSEENHRQEAVLSHDDKVDEEPGRGLDHADLSVRHGDQPVTRQQIRFDVTLARVKELQANLSY